MGRDDFSQKTLDTLAKRVGYRCSNPACGKQTVGPRTAVDKTVNIGVGAHITAAAEKGPRYDKAISFEARQSIENGIWLCQNCSKLIDNDVSKYSVEILKEWKKKAESRAEREVSSNSHGLASSVTHNIKLQLSYKTKIHDGNRHDYVLEVIVSNQGVSPLSSYHIDVEIPTAVIIQHNCAVSQSNRRMSVYRMSHKEYGDILPGDKTVIMRIPYFVDNEIFHDHKEVFRQLVTVTLYPYGSNPIVVQELFEGLQKF